ncbi:nuclear transport factor 2 family protein [Carboxylicivirga mesophila]|uniref:Nuclear transport factor 2 family protein n=1 Tax=Carboxylicivirga mesophila TaxID=1166478 RepID=A0ABS5KA22_9BACT|nr:nuclear transport factor 2 family protein [Carboxylicivirga mesophila]MBS2211874.1 nuclear transport factor 2 family protein [Carboxylicivirga mesophila]
MRTSTSILLVLLLVGLNGYSQKKNGTIYSEHEAINKVADLWKAFESGEKDTYMDYFADSVMIFSHGKKLPWTKANIGKNYDWWHKEFVNIQFRDAKPAYPDALEYKEAGVWVQDWVILTARNIKTGINVHLPIHRLYSFNKDDKVTSVHWYYNNDVFEEIQNSHTTQKNGVAYINHPHIITTRKVMNAFIDHDFELWASFFNPKAILGHIAFKTGEYQTVDEKKDILMKTFTPDKKFHIEQQGYPDCIYYAKDDVYVVYSWWNMTIKKNGEKYTFPFMLSHTFDADGKIVNEMIYGSSNHMEDW